MNWRLLVNKEQHAFMLCLLWPAVSWGQLVRTHYMWPVTFDPPLCHSVLFSVFVNSQQTGRPAPRRWGSPRTSASSCLAATLGPRRTQRRCPAQLSPWPAAPPGCPRTAPTGRPRWLGSSLNWPRRLQRPDETHREKNIDVTGAAVFNCVKKYIKLNKCIRIQKLLKRVFYHFVIMRVKPQDHAPTIIRHYCAIHNT